MQTRRVLLKSLVSVAGLGIGYPAQAQTWPQRPVKIVVPFPPGGNTDGIARIIAQRFDRAFGQQFVVENRPGASGAIAAEAVARSPADGYTLFMVALPQIAVVPAVIKTSYDPAKDFSPISIVGTNPFVLVVNPSLPVRTLGEFVEYARSRPNQLAYAASAGSLVHLSTALFLKQAGLEMTLVTYRGGTAPLNDVVAGHVPVYLASLSGAVPLAKSGALRLLAVSSEQRAPQIPDVPTFVESGYPDYKVLTWNGLMAPAGTPKAIVNRIAMEVASAVKDSTIAARLTALGVDPLGNSPEQFAAQIANDIKLWGEAVKIAGVQAR